MLFTASKVPKYGVFSGSHFLVSRLNSEIYSRILRENMYSNIGILHSVITRFYKYKYQNIQWFSLQYDFILYTAIQQYSFTSTKP